MAFARKILAALIATSLVVVPIGGTGFSNPIAPVEMLMVDQADMPCCPQSDTQDDFKAAACVLKCAALAGAVLPVMTFGLLYISDPFPLTPTDETLRGIVRAPPTHPPPA
jgi:hypothetical protein